MRKELLDASEKVYLTIEFDETNQWFYNNWMGMVSTEQVIRGCQAIIEALRETPCPRMLNDNREIVGSWSAANEWIAQNWTPQVAALGLKRFAHIVAPGIFGQAAAAELVARVGKKFEIRLFQDIELGKAWLQETLAT